MADEGGNGETFVTCQPAHTLRMAREVLMSVMLLMTFLYFLGVIYIFFTDAECDVRRQRAELEQPPCDSPSPSLPRKSRRCGAMSFPSVHSSPSFLCTALGGVWTPTC